MIVDSGNRLIFEGNGIATDFPFSFIVINASDIKVAISDNETGEVEELTKDYFVDTTASKVVYPGYSPGQEPADEAIPEVLPAGKKLIVYRAVPLTQESDLGNKYPFNTIEKGLDKNCILIQQIADAQSRSLTLPVSTPFGFKAALPMPVPRTSFRVNDDGTGYEPTVDPATVLPLVEGIKTEVEALKADTEEFKEQAETAASTAATEAAAEAASAAVSDVQDILDDLVTEVNAAKTTAVASAATATTAATTAAADAVADVQESLGAVVTEVNAAKTTAVASAATATTKASEALTASDNATAKANEASANATYAASKVIEVSAYASSASMYAGLATSAAQTANDKASEAQASATSASDNADAVASDKATIEGYLSNIESSVGQATTAATNASTSASSAASDAATATTAAETASTAQSNAAQSAAAAAQSAADAAASAGGDFIPSSQKGAANGVPTLNGSGKVPVAQIPLAEKYQAPASCNIDWSAGNIAIYSAFTDTTFNFTMSNSSESMVAQTVTLILCNGGSRVINWGNNIKWPGGQAPTLSKNFGTDILTFITYNRSTWYGVCAGGFA